MLRNTQLSAAITYFFPGLSANSEAYKTLKSFICNEYDWLGASVLYYKNTEFMDLISSLSLSIGDAEVIVTATSVRATRNYHNDPVVIFEV